ncbi:MAG: hypothetical protein JXA87_04680 [Thermoleophilia bacterium]|nr:hypothetical protein [Thermoleophilia bacterium]
MPKKKPDDPVDKTAEETPAPKRRAAKPPAKEGTAAKPRAKQPVSKAPATKQPAAKGKPAKAPAAEEAAAKPQAAVKGPAPAAPSVAAPQPADNPLHKKLGLRPGAAGVVVAPPEDDDNPLLPLPEGFVMVTQIDALAPLAGSFDYMQVFARDRGELASGFALLRDKLAPNGSLWVSWMKQAGRGMAGDLNENVIRRMGLTHGMVEVKIAALDRDWAALRLVHRRR